MVSGRFSFFHLVFCKTSVLLIYIFSHGLLCSNKLYTRQMNKTNEIELLFLNTNGLFVFWWCGGLVGGENRVAVF